MSERVMTNMGEIDLQDYYDIVASQAGYKDYREMRMDGIFIEKPEVIITDDDRKEEKLQENDLTEYVVTRADKEIWYKDRLLIKEGITTDFEVDSDVLFVGNSLDEAKAYFDKQETSIRELRDAVGTYYCVEEYRLEEVTYSDELSREDGDFKSADIVEVTPMYINVVSKETYETMATFDNFRDAEDYAKHSEEQVYLDFSKSNKRDNAKEKPEALPSKTQENIKDRDER